MQRVAEGQVSCNLQIAASKLRPYQQKAVNDLFDLIRQGKTRNALIAPTGAGKTVIAVDVIRKMLLTGQQIMFIVHRDELVNQSSAILTKSGIRHGIIKGGVKPNKEASVQIASIQTLKRRDWWQDRKWSWIYDEAHITAWDKFSLRIIEELAPDCNHIFLTATPYRTKKSERMARVAEEAIIVATPKELMDMGYLVPGRYKSLSPADISRVKTIGGDFDTTGLSAVCNTPELIEKLVGEYITHANGKRAIVFGCSIDHCVAIKAEFVKQNIPAEVVLGYIEKEERGSIYEKTRKGENLVLISRDVLTAGFDMPEIEAVLLARPTKSLALHLQMVGRGLRIAPWINKTDCLILDQAANLYRFGRAEDVSRQSLAIDGDMLLPKNKSNQNGQPQTKECHQCGAQMFPQSRECWNCGAEMVPSLGLADDGLRQEKTLTDWDGFAFLKRQTKARPSAAYSKLIDGIILAGITRKEDRSWMVRQFRNTVSDPPIESLLYLAERLDYKPGWAKVQFYQISGRGKKNSGPSCEEIWMDASSRMPMHVRVIAESQAALSALAPGFGDRAGMAGVIVTEASMRSILEGYRNPIEQALEDTLGYKTTVLFRLI